MIMSCRRLRREKRWLACSDLFLNNRLLKLERQDHKDLQAQQVRLVHQEQQEDKDPKVHQEGKDRKDQREDKDHRDQQALATHKVEMKVQEGRGIVRRLLNHLSGETMAVAHHQLEL